MSVVVACDSAALAEIAQRLRNVADQVDGRGVGTVPSAQGSAFVGAQPRVRASFEEFCADASSAEDALAGELRELAQVIDAALQIMVTLDASLSRSLAGFVG